MNICDEIHKDLLTFRLNLFYNLTFLFYLFYSELNSKYKFHSNDSFKLDGSLKQYDVVHMLIKWK